MTEPQTPPQSLDVASGSKKKQRLYPRYQNPAFKRYSANMEGIPKDQRRKQFVEIKRGRGAPEKLDYLKIVDIFETLGKLNITKPLEIGRIIGVSDETIRRYMKLRPELLDAINRGKERGVQMLKLKSFKMAHEGKTDSKVTADMIKYVLSNISNWQPPSAGNSFVGTADKVQVNVYLPEVDDSLLNK